jgi:hypothetical protein
MWLLEVPATVDRLGARHDAPAITILVHWATLRLLLTVGQHPKPLEVLGIQQPVEQIVSWPPHVSLELAGAANVS